MRCGNCAGVARPMKKQSIPSAIESSSEEEHILAALERFSSRQRLKTRSKTSTAGKFSEPPIVSFPPRQVATSCLHRCLASSSGSHKHVGKPAVPSSKLTISAALFCTASASSESSESNSADTSCECGIHEADDVVCICITPGSAIAGSPTHRTVSMCSTASEPRCNSSRGSSLERLRGDSLSSAHSSLKYRKNFSGALLKRATITLLLYPARTGGIGGGCSRTESNCSIRRCERTKRTSRSAGTSEARTSLAT
mmetsp:Transcript_41128/g.87786  ORF Transcript_41128/g.87786 Transcript_41128/m.87786 type:complete len:254 (-) Transcript_41128:359-1120(-)